MEYRKNFYKGVSKYGNSCRPDDLTSSAIYDIFIEPSKAFMYLHLFFGFNLILFVIYALTQKSQLYLFVIDLLLVLGMMKSSFDYVT